MDGGGGEAGGEDVRGDEDLRLSRRGVRGGPVDGPDLVAALGGEADDVGADAAGGSEDGDVHGQVLLFVRAASPRVRKMEKGNSGSRRRSPVTAKAASTTPAVASSPY